MYLSTISACISAQETISARRAEAERELARKERLEKEVGSLRNQLSARQAELKERAVEIKEKVSLLCPPPVVARRLLLWPRGRDRGDGDASCCCGPLPWRATRRCSSRISARAVVAAGGDQPHPAATRASGHG